MTHYPHQIILTEDELSAVVALVSNYYGCTFEYHELQAHVNLLDELMVRFGVHPDQETYEGLYGGGVAGTGEGVGSEDSPAPEPPRDAYDRACEERDYGGSDNPAAYVPSRCHGLTTGCTGTPDCPVHMGGSA